MGSREHILAALRAPAGSASTRASNEVSAAPKLPRDDQLFRDYPASDLLSAFAARFRALSGELLISADAQSAALELLNALKALRSSRIALQETPLLGSLRQRSPNLDQMLQRAATTLPEARAFSNYEVGITGCDYLVARTGSVVLRSHSAGGRALSVLPEVHIVLATVHQLIPSLDHWLGELGADSNFRSATVINGPSRTADIEKILVLGAHGPKRVIVILLQEPRRSSRPPNA
jgi:L-lactate dehydrogenase complex protein LldG